MMLLFSVTVLLAAAAFDVIKVSIYNIADLELVAGRSTSLILRKLF